MTAESLLYLLEHPHLNALKIGVSRKASTRLKQHTDQGWQVLRTWALTTGADAYRLEAGSVN